MGILFFAESALTGAGLAMDAFSVSLANGLRDPAMNKRKACVVAGTFAFFQFAMPMLGWLLLHTVAERFDAFTKITPYVALVLLSFIGGKMIYEGVKSRGAEEEATEIKTTARGLLVQGVATSVDALSVGLIMAEYTAYKAFIASLIIAAVTFVTCVSGVAIGKKFGVKFKEKAIIAGGIILVAIGLEIFIRGVLGV